MNAISFVLVEMLSLREHIDIFIVLAHLQFLAFCLEQAANEDQRNLLRENFGKLTAHGLKKLECYNIASIP